MSNITIDFTKRTGKIKPMNAGNNGPKIPCGDQTSGNFDTYKMIHIPYARLHDANLSTAYGAPHTVDVRAIFKDYDADPEDPANYDFTMTDILLKSLARVGTEPFYRLGGSIEHNPRKWFTCVPPDFEKFAVICEHIIRHCTDDWANGLNMKITYWEIWNEPDLDPDDSINKRNWQGTAAQFNELFCIVFSKLKTSFPHLKFGGPGTAGPIRPGWSDNFFAALATQGLKLDFYSWHCYAYDPGFIVECVENVHRYLAEHDQPQAESILNEWNYVKGWSDEWVYSLKHEAGMKGAAFVLSVMLACQKKPLDMLMYYDFRVSCAMNGLWSQGYFDIQKPWYSFWMFDKLARLGTEVESFSDDNEIYVGAASDDRGRKAVVVCAYSDDDNFGVRKPVISLKGVSDDEKANLTVRLLDEGHDATDIPFNIDGEAISFNCNLPRRFALLIQSVI